ncbi:MAG: SCO family protein [Planctomycetota bacterium]|jgi:protein SCO1/2|nr:SCO family protein [Planctomycetota bacterium]
MICIPARTLVASVVLGALFLVGCGASDSGDSGELGRTPRPFSKDAAGKRIIERKVFTSGERPAPSFDLVDQEGLGADLERYGGSVVVMGFIYTHCPDVCGLLAQTFVNMGSRFGSSIEEGALQLVLITTDPERDDAERGKRYTAAYGGEWTFLSGSTEKCQQVWDDYGVTRTVNSEASYVYHTYKIVLIDENGDIRVDYTGIDDPEAALFKDVEKLLEEKS